MNKSKYLEKLHLELNSYDIDVSFLRDWYSDVLKLIQIAAAKSKILKHPRHAGDNSEDELVKILSDILPSRFKITKGYGVHPSSAKSKEQDIIIYDSFSGATLCKTKGISYIPIESISSSIEVKSNLTLNEFRKSLLNCISIKKLLYGNFEFNNPPKQNIIYGIFAYSSSSKKEKFLQTVNEHLDDIPEFLRPNLIYIHGQGLYLPTENGGIFASLDTILKCDSPYELFPSIIKENESPQALLLFISSILSQCLTNDRDSKLNYFNYVISPIMYEDKINKRKTNIGKVEYYINKHTTWTEHKHRALKGFSVPCRKCNKSMSFSYPPITSKKKYEISKKSFAENNIIFFEEGKKYYCECSNELSIPKNSF